MNKTGVGIASLIGGMILGAAIAVLVTPQSGPELRKKIKDMVDDEVDKVRGKVEDLRDKIEEARCKCNE
ncbi:YtxH domain-containing protein [uncultured Alistipes sp.]|uniref:YtxH domain-containing protein n=1 Tax=uncultured Alistipes sp. TaxID=538949 RepID=UPI0025FB0384|nr:YtxH domain-containing protein [uncultured Alistipes sp.]